MEPLPPIVTKAYDLACWLLPRVNDFPRSHRFVLGEPIDEVSVHAELVEA
jgi:hypothetical protein